MLDNDKYVILRESPPDVLGLNHEVLVRLHELRQAYRARNQMDLKVPECLQKDAKRWQVMANRFHRKDYRNSRAELESLRAIAQWTLDIHCALRGQPLLQINWKD